MEGMEQKRSALESNYFLSNSKITALISNVTKMAKNPDIEADLSQVLDDFLEKLRECDVYLENGIFNMNFAEAALLIQSSADLYSKKVDLLWDIIFDYQKRILLSEEQNGNNEQEIEKLEERKRKYKRKRKTNSDETQTAKLVNNFSFGQVENCDYLGQNYETVDLSKEWKKFRTKDLGSDCLEHASNKNSLFLPNNSVHTQDKDYVGRYDQFHSVSLVEDIFHLEEQKVLADDYNCVTHMRIDSYVVNDFLLDKCIPSDTSPKAYAVQLNEHITRFLQLHKLPEKDTNIPNRSQAFTCKKSYVCLERLPFNIMRDKLRRASLADSLFDDDHMSFVSGHCPSPCNSIANDHSGVNESFNQMSGSCENRSKSCSQDSAFYEDVDDSVNHEETEGDITVEDSAVEHSVKHQADGNTVSEVAPDLHVPSNADVEATKVPEMADPSKEKDTKAKNTKDKEPSPKASSIITRAKAARKWSFILEEEIQEEIPKKRKAVRKMSAKQMQKLATGVSVPYKEFENFCRSVYKPAEGEGIVPEQMSDSDDSDEELNDNRSESDEEEEEEDREQVSPVADEEEEPVVSDLEETSTPEDIPEMLHPCLSPIRNLNDPCCSTSLNLDIFGRTSTPHHRSDISKVPQLVSDADLEQEEISRKNVRDWRSFIIPKLKMLENKADFDIRNYSKKIIDPLRIGESQYFKDTVKGKSSAEVARYFSATLQLANTYNVEITGGVTGEVSNDSFQLKVLNKTLPHELLDEYQAPSEETFMERLERVRTINPHVHSTPITGPPIKKVKHTGSKRKLF